MKYEFKKDIPDVACLRIPTVEGGLTLFHFRYSELSFYDLPSFLLVPLAAIDLEWGRTRVGILDQSCASSQVG